MPNTARERERVIYSRERETMCETERERDRETDRQTDRERQRQRQRQGRLPVGVGFFK